MGLKLSHFNCVSNERKTDQNNSYIKITSEVNQEFKIKPYRSINTSKYDKKYTTKVKNTFFWVSVDLRNKFQEFTEKLMDEEYIDEDNLIQAIKDFQLEYKQLITESEDWAWVSFLNFVVNYKVDSKYL